MSYEIYCDESRHLEHDLNKNPYMVLGGVWCPAESVTDIGLQISEIKKRHNCFGEIKWVNVAPCKLNAYLEIIYSFFSNHNISFRCVVVDKRRLKHDHFNQTHDEFFYKLYYLLIRKKIRLKNKYNLNIGYKDTNSAERIKKLHSILRKKYWYFVDFPEAKYIHSKERYLLQMADLLIGAVGYQYNGFTTSPSKLAVCSKICSLTKRRDLVHSSAFSEDKFDIFELDRI